MISITVNILGKLSNAFERRGRSLHQLIGIGSLCGLFVAPIIGLGIIVMVTAGHERGTPVNASPITAAVAPVEQTSTTTLASSSLASSTQPSTTTPTTAPTTSTSTTSIMQGPSLETFGTITDPNKLNIEPYDPNRLPPLDPNS